jgi:hypothetical protein
MLAARQPYPLAYSLRRDGPICIGYAGVGDDQVQGVVFVHFADDAIHGVIVLNVRYLDSDVCSL